jgi:hypothetical protein
MTTLFKKLNLGTHREILVVDAPASFEPELAELDGITVLRDPKAVKSITFALVFVKTLAEVAAAAKLLPKATGDAIVWLSYPKGTSKRFTCEFHRDNGWAAIEAAGFESVRMVAIDEDWSALRFRRKEYVKSSRPSVAAGSQVGKKKPK